MTGRFAGSVALVTGASGGIGTAVVDGLRAEGALVAGLDLRAPVSPSADLDLAVDVSDAAAVGAAVARVEAELGPVEHVVCAAGVLHAAPVAETDPADLDRLLRINIGGVFAVARAVAPLLASRGRGCLVTIASNAGLVPRNGMAAYGASKAAAIALTHGLGLELAPHGVRCVVVAPGSTETAMQRDFWETGPGAPGAEHGRERTIAGDPSLFRVGIPLGRLAEPEDVVATVLFLLSDQARHITVQTITVDGGAGLGA